MLNFSSADIAQGRREKARKINAESFEELPTEELEEICRSSSGVTPLMHSHDIALAPINHPYFRILGAYDVLEGREGQKYAQNLISFRRPEDVFDMAGKYFSKLLSKLRNAR